ncbi:MAG: hypothetical protein COA33_000310 [Fluviicola sp.]|nr:hypothetical protein [Fluviicola sp.]
MMNKLTYLFSFFIALNVASQELHQEASESQLVIGQSIILTYSVVTAKNDTVLFKEKSDVIEARAITKTGDLSSEGIEFEITHPFIDTFIFQKKSKEWIGKYTITAWDSGLFVIPGAAIIINDSTYYFEDIALVSYLVDPIDGMDIYDIKENFADVPDKPFSIAEFLSDYWWLLLLILFAIIAFIAYRRRNKDEDFEEEERPISLKERTLIAINALEKAKLWEKDQLKDHFVELSYILRSYLTSRYEISLLEKTTYETKLLLTQKGLNEETVDTIARILSEADMVKFAKSKPDLIAILRVSTLAKQIVAETSPLEFDNVE